MARTLEEFLETFVIPLLGGGPVHVGRPLRMLEHELWSGSSQLRQPDLLFLRLRRAEGVLPTPSLPDPSDDELALWMGLHNTLVFDHPERTRVWARGVTWQRVEATTRSLVSLPAATDLHEGLVRHLAVGALLELMRVDAIVATPNGEVRYEGVPQARRARVRTSIPAGQREEVVAWLPAQHQPETLRLLDDILGASPLTCLLHPLLAPPGWSPLWGAGFLRHRGLARCVCHRWAMHRDWVGIGGAVMGAILPSIAEPPGSSSGLRSASARGLPSSNDLETLAVKALPGASTPMAPAALAALVGALIHLHFLKVLELEARIGVVLGSREPGILAFLALPLLLPWLQETTGTPLGGLSTTSTFETQAQRRWSGYVDHLQELVPKAVVENLLSTLVPAIVKTP